MTFRLSDNEQHHHQPPDLVYPLPSHPGPSVVPHLVQCMAQGAEVPLHGALLMTLPANALLALSDQPELVVMPPMYYMHSLPLRGGTIVFEKAGPVDLFWLRGKLNPVWLEEYIRQAVWPQPVARASSGVGGSLCFRASANAASMASFPSPSPRV